MSSSVIIFDKAQGNTLLKLAKFGSNVVAVMDDGSLLQSGDYGMPIRIPPEMDGIRALDLDESSSVPSPSVVMSDGSHLLLGNNSKWMQDHGYNVLNDTWVVSPKGNMWKWAYMGDRRYGRGHDCKWKMVKKIDLPSVKKIVASSDGSDVQDWHVHTLTSDGRIESMRSETGELFLKPAPWAEESWRFTDIFATNGGVHAITTDGQVVTPLVGTGYRALYGGIAWPLPDSDAASFLMDGPYIVVRLKSGKSVYYTTKNDWSGDGFHPRKEWGEGEYIPYPKHITGKGDGEWLELAGSMIAMGANMGVAHFAPPNIRSRGKVKTMKMLGSL